MLHFACDMPLVCAARAATANGVPEYCIRLIAASGMVHSCEKCVLPSLAAEKVVLSYGCALQLADPCGISAGCARALQALRHLHTCSMVHRTRSMVHRTLHTFRWATAQSQ